MLYKCDHCNYSTKRLCDLRRHENRKYPCNRKVKEDTCNLEDNGIMENSDLNTNANDLNTNDIDQESIVDDQESLVEYPDSNVKNQSKNSKFVCYKCGKSFSRNQRLKGHMEKCDGLDKRQCKICLKVFATKQGRYQHMKYVKCSPPIPSSSQPSSSTTNNINNNGTLNIDNSVTNNTYNINIVRSDFYKISNEDIQNIVNKLEKKEYLKMIRNNMDMGKYVIPRTMEQIYFNDAFPKMQTLKKERRNDKMVEVHVGKGKWEKRFIDDIFKMVIGRVEEYHSEYFKHLEQKYQDVVIGSVRWKQLTRPIKTFGNTMLWYNGFRGEGIESMGIELNYPDDDDEMEKERERRNREMEQLVGEKVYEETLARDPKREVAYCK